MTPAAETLSKKQFRAEVALRRSRVKPECMPTFLAQHKPRLCIARAAYAEGRLAKVPTGLSGSPINVTRAGAGTCDHDRVFKQFAEDSMAIGIGLILPHEDLVVLDFDHCFGPSGWKAELINFVTIAKSYTEISSSGEGVHLFLRAWDAVPRFGNWRGVLNGLSIEQYSHKRYIACTFDEHPISWPGIADGEAILAKLESAKGAIDHKPPGRLPKDVKSICYAGPRSIVLTDDDLLWLFRRAKNRGKFSDLFKHGLTHAYDGDDSRADLALLSMMAFYTQDPEQLERLFNLSALGQRCKWQDRVDYRIRSIQSALSKREVGS